MTETTYAGLARRVVLITEGANSIAAAFVRAFAAQQCRVAWRCAASWPRNSARNGARATSANSNARTNSRAITMAAKSRNGSLAQD
jgi:hypothetical protein